MKYELIKEIKVLGEVGKVGTIYDTDNPKVSIDGPFKFDFDNEKWFRKYVEPKFKEKEDVLLNRGYGKPLLSTVLTENCKNYKVLGGDGKVYEVEEDKLSKPDVYYFVNTTGCICKTYRGLDSRRDSWLFKLGMMFKTKDEALAYIDVIYKMSWPKNTQ